MTKCVGVVINLYIHKANYNILPSVIEYFLGMYNIILDKDIHNQHPYNHNQLKVNLITVKLNNNGFADLLSSNLELHNDLKYAKNKINQINTYLWDDLKKYTNPYELIYAFNCRDNTRDIESSVATIKPLSRSFFKMIEIIHEFIPELLVETKPLISLHICEGPGGFIEATRFIRGGITANHLDKAFGITLSALDDKKTIPAWKQTGFFLRNNPNVVISYGADGTGNIYNTCNIRHLANEISSKTSTISFEQIDSKQEDSKIHYGKCAFITADGGFDYSIDYNYQEQASTKLIFSQILCGIYNQAKNGTFICKIFDMNLYITIEMLYILYSVYEEIYIFKPFTSRIANSEKYIVCSRYKGCDNSVLEILFEILNKWNNMTGETINQLFESIPIDFINTIKRINQQIVKNQIKSINDIMHIYYNRLNQNEQWKKENTKKQYENAINWCKKYNIPYKKHLNIC